MTAFLAQEFFELQGFEHAALFRTGRPVWEAIGEALDAYLAVWDRWDASAGAPAGVHVLGGPIWIAQGCAIEPGAVLRGPLIVGEGCEIRTGA
ncbi:MAG TPA: hypothetical protein PK435_16215, partial [Thermoanaerobaculaceae bacterium]|nr:hypothetical protein [Thermoanaerobaculaceae bacterium]